MLLAASALWNGSVGLRLAEVIESLDAGPCDELCALVVAAKYGGDAVDEWLAEHEPRMRPVH